MKRVIALTLVLIAGSAFSGIGVAEDVTLVVKGSSWDSDSRGFASIAGLSIAAGTEKAARRGSRISLDGRPEIYAISGPQGEFEFTFTTSSPSFRVVVEGDRFAPTVTQPYKVPQESGELDIGPVFTPRAEGSEHS